MTQAFQKCRDVNFNKVSDTLSFDVFMKVLKSPQKHEPNIRLGKIKL